MISSLCLQSPSSRLIPSCTRWRATAAEAVVVAGVVDEAVAVVAEEAAEVRNLSHINSTKA